MTNTFLRNNALVFSFLTLLFLTNCKSDDCSGLANSVPPYETISLRFVDPEGNDVSLDTKQVTFTSKDQSEQLQDQTAPSFIGFSLHIKRNIPVNTIEIAYNKENILVLDYTKKKTQVECQGTYYYIDDLSLTSVSEQYKVKNQHTATGVFNFVIEVAEKM